MLFVGDYFCDSSSFRIELISSSHVASEVSSEAPDCSMNLWHEKRLNCGIEALSLT